MSPAKFPAQPVLLVDDDELIQTTCTLTLRNDGINNIVQCSDSRDVEQLVADHDFSVILLDLNMPDVPGEQVLAILSQKCPEVPVIVITGVDDVGTAVKCMRTGAFDYLVKPVEADVFIAATRRGIEIGDMLRENSFLKERLLASEVSDPGAFEDTVTANASMQALFQYIEAVAGTSQPILITGETGVGKELIARAVHKASRRRGEFVPVNIAGLDDNVFSDTLFGHTKGAFTGALEARRGLIEKAAGGTLFLDEIGELQAQAQVKLLRLIQEREYLAIGSDAPKYTDARIVVATNKSVEDLRSGGQFREDLFFRLRSHHVHVPPLRERLDDLPLLLDHFVARAVDGTGKRKPTFPPELLTLLRTYEFPGNIRELEAMVFNAVTMHRSGVLSLDPFRAIVRTGKPRGRAREASSDGAGGGAIFRSTYPLPSIRDAEEVLIEEALRRTNGNQTMAAEMLGVTRQTLNRHLKRKHGR